MYLKENKISDVNIVDSDESINVSEGGYDVFLSEEEQKLEELINKNLNGISINSSNMFYLVSKIYEIVDSTLKINKDKRDDYILKLITKLLKKNKVFEDDELEEMKNSIIKDIELIVNTASGNNKLQIKKNKKKGKDLLSVEDAINVVLDKVEGIIREKKYIGTEIIQEIIPLTTTVMELVEDFPNLSGIDKKTITLEIISKLVKEKMPKIIEIDEKTQKIINKLVDSLPMTIDIVISISRNRKKIGKKLKNIFKCCC